MKLADWRLEIGPARTITKASKRKIRRRGKLNAHVERLVRFIIYVTDGDYDIYYK